MGAGCLGGAAKYMCTKDFFPFAACPEGDSRQKLEAGMEEEIMEKYFLRLTPPGFPSLLPHTTRNHLSWVAPLTGPGTFCVNR